MRLKIAGGCGEHGRNCFLVETTTFSFLVDCGNLVCDYDNHPRLNKEEIQQLRYVFLTHSHADHSGALPWLIENGFNGWVIASSSTLQQLPFTLDRCLSLEEINQNLDGLNIYFGRSGHCEGSVWYRFEMDGKVILFSGDYTENSQVYAVDLIRDQTANFAILDCAYGYDERNYEDCCKEILMLVKNAKSPLVFTVPKYGRGLELCALIHKNFPKLKISGDEHFIVQTKRENEWYKTSLRDMEVYVYNKHDMTDIIFISDPQLRQKSSIQLVEEVLVNGSAVMSGNVEEKSYSEQLIQEGRMKKVCYPVHLNKKGMDRLVKNNNFQQVIAYHSPEIVCDIEYEF